MRLRAFLAGALVCGALIAGPAVTSPGPLPSPPPSESAEGFVGTRVCRDCHAATHSSWTNGRHSRMLQEARPSTVIPAFEGAVTLHDKPHPAQSGRRWDIVDLEESSEVKLQVWNSNCFGCHVSGEEKGFDPATRTYRTTWTDFGTSCERCHGPGGAHAAKYAKDRKPTADGVACPRATAALLNATTEAHPALRLVSVLSLSDRTRDPAIREAVRRALEDSRRTVRMGATLGLLNSERLSEAVRDHTARARFLNEDSGVQLDLGKMLFLAGAWKEAESSLRDALRLEPQIRGGHYFLGLATLGQGRVEEATALLKRVDGKDPHRQDAEAMLAKLKSLRAKGPG